MAVDVEMTPQVRDFIAAHPVPNYLNLPAFPPNAQEAFEAAFRKHPRINIKPAEDIAAERHEFRKTARPRFAVAGSGFGGIDFASKLRKKRPDIQVVVYEKRPRRIGGLVGDIISQVMHGGTSEKNLQRMLKITGDDPGIDLVFDYEVPVNDSQRLHEFLTRYGYGGIFLGTGGPESNPFGRRPGVKTVTESLKAMQEPINTRGFLIPADVAADKKLLALGISRHVQGGGKASQDAMVALGFADGMRGLADAGVPIERIDPRSVYIEGQDMVGIFAGLDVDLSEAQRNQLLYRRGLGTTTWIDQAGELKKLGLDGFRHYVAEQMPARVKDVGGSARDHVKIIDVAPHPDGGFLLDISPTDPDGNVLESMRPVTERSRGVTWSAGFMKAEDPAFDDLVVVSGGIRSRGEGNIAATAKTVAEALEKAEAQLSHIDGRGPGAKQYDEFLAHVDGEQKRVRYDGNPIAWMIQRDDRKALVHRVVVPSETTT